MGVLLRRVLSIEEGAVTDLAAFTNRPECPKCGNVMFSWQWNKDTTHLSKRPGKPGFPPPQEHLWVSCDRCGWAFAMRTKDAT